MVILAVSTVTAVSAVRFLRLVLGCRNCKTILSDLTLQTGPRQKSPGLNAEASVELLALYMIINSSFDTAVPARSGSCIYWIEIT